MTGFEAREGVPIREGWQELLAVFSGARRMLKAGVVDRDIPGA
jgi:hypothetical protein